MAHNLVKLITDEDGEKMHPVWHFPFNTGDGNRVLCSGQVFGEGEGLATFETKIVQRGGITCQQCLNIIKSFKKVRL